jgi:hypothetical protein
MSAAPLPLRLWLLAGVFALILFPEVRGHHPLIGWLPFWLLIAPLLSLAAWRLLNRAPAPPRRRRQARRSSEPQARRLRRLRQAQAA